MALSHIMNDTLLYRLMDQREREQQEQAQGEAQALQNMYDLAMRQRGEEQEHYKRMLDVAKSEAKLAKSLGQAVPQYKQPEVQRMGQMGAAEAEFGQQKAVQAEERKQRDVEFQQEAQLGRQKGFLDYQLSKGYPWRAPRSGRGGPVDETMDFFGKVIDDLGTEAKSASELARLTEGSIQAEEYKRSQGAWEARELARRLQAGLGSGDIGPDEARAIWQRSVGDIEGRGAGIGMGGPRGAQAPQAPQAPQGPSEEDAVVMEELRKAGIQ